jgi:hypothetical protein
MHFNHSPKVEKLRPRVQYFMDTYILPRQAEWKEAVESILAYVTPPKR